MQRGFTLVESIAGVTFLGVIIVLVAAWFNVFTTQSLEERWAASAHVKCLQMSQSYLTSDQPYAVWAASQATSGVLLQGMNYALTLTPNTSPALPSGFEGITAEFTWQPRPGRTRSLSVALLRPTP